jgi:F-type H+-transporting ATPase subunit b
VLARRALGDMASADLQEQIALSFAQQLEDLDESALEDMARGLRDSGAGVTIRSRFELPATAKRRITKTLHERLNHDAEVAYEARDDISCGIELKAGSRTVSWNFGSYLDGLEKTVDAQYSSVLASAGGFKDE